MAGAGFGVREVRIRGFRSAREVSFRPGPVCALVGGPSVGKSNVLEAVWRLLGREAPAPAPTDVTEGSGGTIELTATLAGGDEVSLTARPPEVVNARGQPVPVLFLPAALRSGVLIAPGRDLPRPA